MKLQKDTEEEQILIFSSKQLMKMKVIFAMQTVKFSKIGAHSWRMKYHQTSLQNI